MGDAIQTTRPLPCANMGNYDEVGHIKIILMVEFWWAVDLTLIPFSRRSVRLHYVRLHVRLHLLDDAKYLWPYSCSKQGTSEDGSNPAEKAWLTAPLPNPTVRSGNTKLRRQRDEHDYNLGSEGGRKKPRTVSRGRARGRGLSADGRGARRLAGIRHHAHKDDSGEEEEEEDYNEVASGETSASSGDPVPSSGTWCGADSSGGHVHVPALKPRRGAAGLPAPVQAHTKHAMHGKRGRSGRGAK